MMLLLDSHRLTRSSAGGGILSITSIMHYVYILRDSRTMHTTIELYLLYYAFGLLLLLVHVGTLWCCRGPLTFYGDYGDFFYPAHEYFSDLSLHIPSINSAVFSLKKKSFV